jgi:hypothetical protein
MKNRTTKFATLSLLALTLISCKGSTTSESTSEKKPISTNPISAVDSTESTEVSDTTSSAGGDSASVSTSTGDSTGGGESPVSESTDIYSQTEWPKDIVDAMVQYLGGNVIPHTKFYKKKSSLGYEWNGDTNTLTITGGADYADSYIATAKADYTNAGWDTTGSSTTVMHAVSPDDPNLAVDVKEGTGGEEGFVNLFATYTEPFDETKFTKWPDLVLNDFNTYLDGHALPLIYLGTNGPVSAKSTYDKYLQITGAAWDDRVFSLGKKTLQDDGWEVSEATSGTYFSSYSVGDYGKVLIATKSFDDGCELTVELTENTNGKAEIRVAIKQKYDAGKANGDWLQDTKTAMDTNLDNHRIPYVYLATNAETASYSPYSKTLTINGGDWDDGIITDPTYGAKAAFENDSADGTWTVSVIAKDASTSDNNRYSDNLVATKTCSDGCKISVSVYGNYSGLARMVITFELAFKVPANATKYSDATQAIIDAHFGKHAKEFPYLYIGTTTDTATWDATTGTMTVTDTAAANTWMPGVNDYAGKAIDAIGDVEGSTSGWTHKLIKESYGDYYDYYYNYYEYFQASITYDDGTVYTITIDSDFNKDSYYDDPDDGNVIMYVNVKLPYDASKGTGDWTDATKAHFTAAEELNGNTIPYVYLNTDAETASWDKSKGVLTIAGGVYDELMIDEFKKQFTAANGEIAETANQWVVKEVAKSTSSNDFTYYGAGVKATRVTENGETLVVTLAPNASTNPSADIKVTYRPKFVLPADGDWTDDTKKLFASSNDGHAIPFVYLFGTESAVSSTNGVTVTGGWWYDEIATNAADVLAKDGWKVVKVAKSSSVYSSDINYYSDAITATKVMENDSCTVTVNVFNSRGTAKLTASFAEGYNVVNAAGMWGSAADIAAVKDGTKKTTAVQDSMTKNLGEVLPYFYLGAKAPTFSISTSLFRATGVVWDNEILDNAKTAFSAEAGWSLVADDCQFGSSYSTYYNKALVFQKQVAAVLDDTGAVVTQAYNLFAIITKDSSNHGELIAFRENAATVSGAAWTATDSEAITTALHGQDVPFFTMGGKAVSPSSGTDAVTFSATAYTCAEMIAFALDLKNNGYDVSLKYEDSSYATFGFTVSAKKTNDDGSKQTITSSIPYKYTSAITSSINITVTYVAPFKSTATEWSGTVTTGLTTLLGDASLIPYFYLGDDNPRTYYSSYSNYFEIYGALWDDAVIDNMKTAFTADNTARKDEIFEDDDYAWTIRTSHHGETVLVADRKTADGNWITVELKKTSDKIYLYIYLN